MIDRTGELQVRHLGIGARPVDYESALAEQRRLHALRVAGQIPDTLLLLEHPAVFTAGKRTEVHERPTDGTPVVDVDRGGKITFHGPGQLVGYPIVALPDHVYVVDYVRRLEEALIRVCADLGLATGRVAGRTGVWRPAAGDGIERKLAAIGIRVSGKVAMHGFALNADVDLDWFARIIPCGIADAGVTSLTEELGREVTVGEVLDSTERHVRELLSWTPYVRSDDLPRPTAAGSSATSVPVR